MRVVSVSKVLGAAAICAFPGAAFAQSSVEDISISPEFSVENVAGARNDSGLSPAPINAGPFMLKASVAVVGGYDTNLLRSVTEKGDAFVAVLPRVQANLDTGRYQLRLGGSANLRRFASLETENSEEFQITSGLGFAVMDGIGLNAGASFGHLVQERSSLGTIAGAAETVSYDQFAANLGTQISLGDLRIGPSVRYSQQDYSPVELLAGGEADVSFRDQRSYGGSLSLGYQVSELIEVFVEGGIDEDESIRPAAGRSRDSSGKTVLGGVRGELTPLLQGEIAVGYRERDYDNVLFTDTDGLTFRANLQWFPTELISFRLTASQAVQNSGQLQNAAVVSSRAAVEVYYDPTRRLRLAGTIAFTHRDFRDTNTTANNPSLRVQAQYRFSQHLALGSYAMLSRQTVDGVTIVDPNTSFNVGLGIVLTP